MSIVDDGGGKEHESPVSLIRFIIKSALRNKRRAALTALSSGFSLFLLFAMQTFLTYLVNPPRAAQSELRLVVSPTTSMLDTLPISYLKQIEKVPHVRNVSQCVLFPGNWRDDPRNMIRTLGIDPDRFWDVFPDIHVAPEVKQALHDQKSGVVVGHELMQAYGWKPGETIVLKGVFYPFDLEFKILGEFQWDFRSNLMMFNYEYFSDVTQNHGATMFWVAADSAESIPQIKDTIDELFHNSGAETRTETEKSFVLSALSRIGNVQMLMGAVALVVVFTMLLVSGSNMALTMRERSREVGILKSLGYPWQWVLGLLLGEAAFLALLGEVIAVLITFSMLFVPFQKITAGLIGSFPIAPVTLAVTLGIGLALGILAAFIPTFQASRMSVLQAMKRTD